LAHYRDFIERFDIDLVHAHNFHHFLPEYGLALTELRREDNLPTFLTIHEMWGEFLCRDLLERTEWDGIIAVGQHVYGDVIAQEPELANLQVILHGVNTEMFRPDNDGSSLKRELGLEGQRVILHPARLLPWKGVHTTVEAFRMLADRYPDVFLIITDTHEILDWADELHGYREQIFSMVEDNGLSDRIVMRSFDFAEELPQAYALSDIIIYPTSGEEPFGLVPLEAMASGKPIVVSLSGGLIESVVDGVTGFVIPKENATLLADRLSTLLKSPGLARRMGQAGRRHVEKHFTRRRMADEVNALYRQKVAVSDLERTARQKADRRTPEPAI
jgi:glycosyltransferase involved in cell wall biosynthesis